MKLQVRTVHFKADQKLLDFIETKMDKLDTFFDRIQGATVFLKLENSGQVRDKIVEIKLHVPRDIIIATGEHKTFETAFENAFNVVKRGLNRYKEKIRAHT